MILKRTGEYRFHGTVGRGFETKGEEDRHEKPRRHDRAASSADGSLQWAGGNEWVGTLTDARPYGHATRLARLSKDSKNPRTYAIGLSLNFTSQTTPAILSLRSIPAFRLKKPR